jgi:ABC-2 type transport system ATP-binding protein
MEKLGLQGRERQIIRSLSKGYKQRLGLAQAIMHNPDLLILDEPTSGLDPKQIIEIRQLIRELGEKHTVLLSTHILPEVNALCNRVLIINEGKIVLDDSPDQIGKTMGETFEVSLEVKGARETIVRELEQMNEVGSIHIHESDPTEAASSTVKLRVASKEREDIREALFFKMADLRLPILAMKQENLSLEDIFLKLTTAEKTTESLASAEIDAPVLEVDEDA